MRALRARAATLLRVTSGLNHEKLFHVRNDPAEIPRLRATFVEECRAAGVALHELDVWQLVFTEMVQNSLEHGCISPEDTVEVSFSITPTMVELCVTDPGRGGVSQDDVEAANCEGFQETGRGAGLFLIREFTDEFHIRPCEGRGTQIHVVKYRADQASRDA